MHECRSEKTHWLEFEQLSECKGLTHALFLREGPSFDAIGVKRWAACHQVHGKEVLEAAEWERQPKGDGLMTDERGLGLLIKHADCQATILYDPICNALAHVHCGWRGNVANIYRETVDRLKSRYGVKPQNLLVGISPSLGPDKAEFRNFRTELPETFWPFQKEPTYFDLWEISRWQLMECGVLDEHIEIARLCTHSDPVRFFSYRRDHTKERHISVAAIRR